MNQWLGKNVRRMREERHWTQQHLADAADIQLRTVQRVEKGEGANAETLQALAAVFDTSIDQLQVDWDAVAAIREALLEESRKQEEELRKTHHVVRITPVTSSADLDIIGSTMGLMPYCFSDDDDAQDAFASLKQNAMDCLDIWDDVGATGQREFAVSLFEQTKELGKLGMVVGTGTRRGRWHRMDVTILYLVAMPKDDVRSYIAEPKDGTDVKEAV